MIQEEGYKNLESYEFYHSVVFMTCTRTKKKKISFKVSKYVTLIIY